MKKGFTHIELLVILVVLAILASGVWVWLVRRGAALPAPSTALTPTIKLTNAQIPTVTSVFTPVLTIITTPSLPSPTPQPDLIKVVIPTDWQTYDRDFAGTHFIFKYPPVYQVADGDPDSGEIYLTKEGEILKGVTIDVFSHLFVGRIEEYEYKTGSRRVWFEEKILRGYFNYKDLDLSGLTFEEINFANGKRYLKVNGWPEELKTSYLLNDDFYFGIQNGISVFLVNKESLNSEDTLKVLSSLEVSR